MDLAYDHIVEESYTKDEEVASAATDSGSKNKKPEQPSSLNSDLQEAYKAFSSSPWGARIGGFLGNVVKQGECIYHDAQQELTAVSQDATRGFNDLRDSIINRTRSISLAGPAADMTNEADKAPTAPKDLSSDEAIKESETVLSRLRLEAGKRLKDLQKAEDAADEALLRFGSNLRDFLREAITIAPPAEGSENNGNTVLFESKDAQGKRVIHTSRFDAQLHVIHTSVDSFTEDPTGSGYEAWTKEFDIEKKTEEISKDLAKYPELRATMENLVPNHVPYAKFWTRYYYLRHSIEVAEARRRDLLKAASTEEEVAWDEESDDEAAPRVRINRPASAESSTTIQPPTVQVPAKSPEPRKSNDEKSQPDSEASYDVVGATSGVASQAPSSPKESRRGEDSDEEDWE